MIPARAALAVVISTLLIAPAAVAADSDRADALFRAGRDALRAGNVDTACARFRESNQIDPQPGTKLNLAACEEKRGHLGTALDLFRAVLRELPESDERAAISRERARALEKRIPQVTFRLAARAPATTALRIADISANRTRFGVAMPLDPGKHELVVTAAGFEQRRIELTLAEGDRRVIEIAPGSKQAGERVEPAPDRTLAYVLGAIGIAGLAVGGVTGVLALGKKQTADEHCSDALELCDQEGADANDAGRTLATVSTIGFAVGAVGLGAGAYFLLRSGDREKTAIGLRPHGAAALLDVRASW